MQIASIILLFVLLIISAIQDFKYRGIIWYIFPLLGVLSLTIGFQHQMVWQEIIQSFIFLIIIISCLQIYFSIKEKKWIHLFKTHLGIGDVLFFIAVIPLFSNVSYILFFITGMFVSGITHLIISRLNKKETVPLAGYLAIYLMLLQIIDLTQSDSILYKQWML